MKKILNRTEVLKLLSQGYKIHWIGGIDPSAFVPVDNEFLTVRWDTLRKLQDEGIVTSSKFFPELHGKVELKK